MTKKWVSGIVLLFTFFLLRVSIASYRWRGGGGIPETLCNAWSGINFSVPVMMRHALLSSASIFEGWQDLAQTGAQCLAVE